jgi:hypothetical protein
MPAVANAVTKQPRRNESGTGAGSLLRESMAREACRHREGKDACQLRFLALHTRFGRSGCRPSATPLPAPRMGKVSSWQRRVAPFSTPTSVNPRQSGSLSRTVSKERAERRRRPPRPRHIPAGGRGFGGVPQQPAGRVGGKEAARDTGRRLAFSANPARVTPLGAHPEDTSASRSSRRVS